MFFVYILYSEEFDIYYVGQTSDIDERIRRHNRGYEKYTSKYVPWTLVLKLEKGTRIEAIKLERKIKNLNRKRLIEFIDKYS